MVQPPIVGGFMIARILGSLCIVLLFAGSPTFATDQTLLSWNALPDLPDDLGVAGPFAGVHNDGLIVAGGANFPRPVWESDKVWRDRIHVLTRTGGDYVWKDGGTLHRPIAYGAAVSVPDGLNVPAGVVCMGGNDSSRTFDDVFRLTWNPETGSIDQESLPSLPQPCAFGAATLIGTTIYLAGGQSGPSLESAMSNFWSLDLSRQATPEQFQWEALPPWPGPPRALNLTVHQHNGYDECVYVIGGRNQQGDDVQFLSDTWEFNPSSNTWRTRRDAPRCIMAGTAIGVGQSHVFVLGGADGSLFHQTDRLRDKHPGFPHKTLAYHTITDTWTEAGPSPANHVTTIAVPWGDSIIVPSGEIRPRVRSPKVFRVTVNRAVPSFGMINYIVLFSYLLSMVGVGVYFAKKNKSTDDYFRGGSRIPWWAAGCSIFATMLSSLTFTGIPSKSYAQDWVYVVGNFTIPLVAIVAVYVALPFFRRIDATSAYEYLEKRFNRSVRRFGSASFTLFHVFRMAVVMSLTGLAMAIATPLTPTQSVLLMGVLSIAYCTLGGVEAVIWTDTIQTIVLFGGGILALILLVAGTDGGFTGFLSAAHASDKFDMANLHLSPTNAQIGLWVIIVGAIGQNLSSYTADQAVVQRYMTTANQRLAARSIWTNAVLSVPASLLFFAIGTALFAFYQSHPEKLDATITTDQVFPLFIAREMPIGVAGLIVAGVFAAAQSTVSTSMNSTATAIVTDFLRPWNVCRSDQGYLRYARGLTLLMGVLGTLLGLVFVDPSIKSLFDTFLVVIGLFMGVLGGLFILGGTTTRANAAGAMTGAMVGAATMFGLWKFTAVNGYLYTSCGITTCFVVGYLASLAFAPPAGDLAGLTIHTLPKVGQDDTPSRKASLEIQS
ncbi:Sodium/glucose cotransporter [Rubripirellula lacrimiformis]|uniref:Sodium/glucose cotransporter n=1 Tax=Rubripirellula lacrimiformis TaxID=1930273 RepID=A0A517NET7_9BACT|nr:sodium/solute symporter [Rubripirellula lacrimiformis]QDT05641.1 Sodium/glucose cotransporter [Rubripirellula lacrimiformis]